MTAEGRLARLGFADVGAAVRAWDGIAIDNDMLLESLALSADPDLAIRTMERMVVGTGQQIQDLRDALLHDLRLGHHLALVLGASSALGDHLVSHPDDWRELLDVAPSGGRAWADGFSALAQAKDRDELRRSYRRLLLGVAARDLSGADRVDETAVELADLAAAAVDAALEIAKVEVGEAAALCRLSVIGLGKCGARELNYVSDVDVIFVAEPVEGAGENAAIRAATALASATMRICSDHTAEGTLWPVDAGLRPEGKSGPLVRSVSSHEAYYRRWAKSWEFQALLKARPIAGDLELGAHYMEVIAPLVWVAADRPDFVPDVQAMRRRVVSHIPASKASRQIKLGPGGLRDIEFAVQLLQLVHGRSDLSLRAPDTVGALEALTSGGYVGRQDGAALVEAYRFLRTLEHRLQLVHLRRTHVVPEDPTALRALGRSLGMLNEPTKNLTSQWRKHAREVRRLHEKLFYRPLLEAVAAIPSDEARLTAADARERLEALGYADPVAALQHLEALSTGVTRRAAIQRTLLPAMLGWFADAPDPDAGLLAFRQLSDHLGTSHWFLRMLRDEGAAAQRLAHLLATSRFAAELLMRAPEATSLLARNADLLPRDGDELIREATNAARRYPEPMEAIGAVRALRRRELFRVAAGDVAGLLDIDTVGCALSDIARATLEGGLVAAQAGVELERRAPLQTRFAIIAMGRLGGWEMSYSSDADVLFVHDPLPGADEREASEAAFAVAQELRRMLALPGPEPALVVDAGLRPEGRQGPLVRSLTSYAKYYERWSKVWEAQALLRARPIAGDTGVGERFVALADGLRYPPNGLEPSDIAEIRRIKARVEAERLPRGADRMTHLKLGPGGLADVEWTVQLLQLRHGAKHPRLRTTQTMRALDAAVDAGLVTAADASRLSRSWRMAGRIRNASMLARGRASDSLPSKAADRMAVAYLCGYSTDEASLFDDDYLRVARQATAAVDRVFWE